MSTPTPRIVAAAGLLALLLPVAAAASQISGIRITQTGNTGLTINVDVTAFYTLGSTGSEALLGTYYNAVPAADWGDGSTLPRYGYGPSTGIPLVATSTVVNGTPARAYRGSFSYTYGAPGNYTIEANSRCCPVITPTDTVVSGSIVTTTVMTTGTFGPTTFTTSFVRNSLEVNAGAPGFSKAFAPDTTPVGVASTLVFTIDGTANTLDNDSLAFTDNLPAGLTVASPSGLVNTCGGAVTATPGTAVIELGGGTQAAGSTCTVSVDVVSQLPGVYNNTSGELSSTFGMSGTASGSLTVTAVAPPFSKAFAPASVGVGVASTLSFTIDNSANAAPAASLDFTDDLPAGLVVAQAPGVVDTCTGGTVKAAAGSGTISYTGGSAGANSTCTISIDVEAASPGFYANTTGDLTSTFGNSGTAEATLIAGAAPLFAKAFDPDMIEVGEISTLTFTIDNSANVVETTGLAFTDNLPAGMVVAEPANVADTCGGGTLTAVPGSGLIDFAGGTVGAGSVCTISVDITITSPGDFENDAGVLSSSFGSSTPGDATAPLGGGTLLDIPTTSTFGLAVLASVLGLLAMLTLRRRP